MYFIQQESHFEPYLKLAVFSCPQHEKECQTSYVVYLSLVDDKGNIFSDLTAILYVLNIR